MEITMEPVLALVESRRSFESFAHYTIGTKGGRATLSLILDNGRAKVGVAYCSFRDHFSKKKGRMIAKARRDAENHRYSFTFERNEQKLHEQLYEEFKTFAINTGWWLTGGKRLSTAPKWVERSFPIEDRQKGKTIIHLNSKEKMGNEVPIVRRLKGC
jgi:hypothetical protein